MNILEGLFILILAFECGNGVTHKREGVYLTFFLVTLKQI